MSVRRWISIVGVSVAVAGGAAATFRTVARPEFEAQVTLRMPGPPPAIAERIQVLSGPDVRESVRLRLGDAPPLRVSAAAGDIVVRSRGATAFAAAEATRAYADSYVDLRRRQGESDRAASAEAIGRMVDTLEAQIVAATDPQRASFVEARLFFLQRLDQLLQGDAAPTEVEELTPPAPVVDGARRAWIVAALGVAVGLGAAASGRRAGSTDAATRAAVSD